MKSCQHCESDLGTDDTRCSHCFEFDEQRLNEEINRYYADSKISNPNDDTVFRHEDTFREKVKLLFPRLERAARERETVTKPDVEGNGLAPYPLKYYLGAVSTIEHRDGRPLLTSVFVNKGRGFPEEGYFRLVEYLDGLPDDITNWSQNEKQDWWEQHLEQTYQTWETN